MATIVTCAIFATATGIIGAVVTLMGLLAFPAMLKAGYSVRLAAGAVTAGGTLGILIPPSVLLILYGATAGVSVVQLYAGAFFPGIMLAGFYVVYVIINAKIKPSIAPPLSEEDQRVTCPNSRRSSARTRSSNVMTGLIGAIKGKRNADVPMRTLLNHLGIALAAGAGGRAAHGLNLSRRDGSGLRGARGVAGNGLCGGGRGRQAETGDLEEAEEAGGLQEPPAEDGQKAPAAAESPKAPAEAKPATPPRPRPRRPSASPFPPPTGSHSASSRRGSRFSMRSSPSSGSRSSRCCWPPFSRWRS